ncbi:MAG TPA: nitrite reductase large subunit NirB, partial [Myxococcota bacterium]|nr:nitrite reductase large subunit NirB [Myxococcota bacterium]
GADLSTQLKLLGVEVASFGVPFADEPDPEAVQRIVYEDAVGGVYQKLLVAVDAGRLLGGMLVGDAAPFRELVAAARSGAPLPARGHELLFGAASPPADAAELGADAQVCSCNQVTRGEIAAAIAAQQLTSVGGVKACTRAGTGCGGCLPAVARILEAELERAGQAVDRNLCEHFPYTRQELFWIVKLGRVAGYDALLASHGRGDGCEVCRPAVASILASTWNDLVLRHDTIQDTNDRFLANIQRGGTYSVVPRVPGGEITPEKLIVLGEVARRYDLYCKITGGQRIDLLGARVEQLPAIWEELVVAGFESGHAYGKAMRTVKSCVGSTWCRYGVQDSTGFAIRVEERYRGIRAPHKLKAAVSGCIRECAEAQSKDFGLIATEQGWNVYVCGNGGARPRHADLLAADVDEATAIRLLDRFLMFYIQTASPLQRTAPWLESLDGGLAYLRKVVVDDSLGIAAQLEADMRTLVDSYRCEWKEVVADPALRARFRHFADGAQAGGESAFVRERGQRRPADWPGAEPPAPRELPPADTWEWVRVARVDDFPADGGSAARHGDAQIAVFHFARRGEWYATENVCPHRKEAVLARGLLGSEGEEPKVACPMHKKTFSLWTGKGLADPDYAIRTFPVRVEGEHVFVKLPPADRLARAACPGATRCAGERAEEGAPPCRRSRAG